MARTRTRTKKDKLPMLGLLGAMAAAPMMGEIIRAVLPAKPKKVKLTLEVEV